MATAQKESLSSREGSDEQPPEEAFISLPVKAGQSDGHSPAHSLVPQQVVAVRWRNEEGLRLHLRVAAHTHDQSTVDVDATVADSQGFHAGPAGSHGIGQALQCSVSFLSNAQVLMFF